MSSIAANLGPDEHTPHVNAADDTLQMLSALEQIVAGFPLMAGEQAAGLTMERRVNGLTGIARVLLQLLSTETGLTSEQLIDQIRNQLVLRSAGLE
ncbi:hypothetical protein ACFVAJ_16390 [Agromyces sp. NPDC057679]|uniref:hypothetical protein n=1 Tax=Agromyces sp. NPDC057679 TaxID=3346207 RepID=UPI003672F50C